MRNRLRLLCLLIISMMFIYGDGFAQAFKSEADLRKQAEKNFNNEDYAAALPQYSQLLSLNQKDTKLNYRYGVCLLMADKDKTSAYNYLEFASRDPKSENEVYFYIGKAQQLKYRFDDAISAYKEFIKRAGAGTAKKFDTEHQIETCNNAKELLKTRTNVIVKSSRQVSQNAIYGAYDLSLPAGKLLATSDRFMTPADKKKVLTPVMFLTADGQTVYYASFGKSDDNGKDIYVAHKLTEGLWGEPQNLGKVVNSKEDEDYPYMDADGKTLYFSSKGHNSMGGYDLFKTTYNAASNEWSTPENMGAGINSPDDDIFYMPVSDGEAQFASTKETAKGTIMVYRVEVAASQKAMATVHGKYKSVDQARADGKISVLRKSDRGMVATSRTDQRTGEYELLIPTGDDYEIVVEGGGYMAHVEDFSLPKTDGAMAMKQEITMNRAGDVEQLEIRNQYVQTDTTAVASVIAKEPQVIKDEYPISEMKRRLLEPITIDGKTIYATPSKNKDTSGKVNPSLTEKTAVVNDTLTSTVRNNEDHVGKPVTGQEAGKASTSIQDMLKEDKAAPQTTAANIQGEKKTNVGEAKNEEKKTTAGGSQQDKANQPVAKNENGKNAAAGGSINKAESSKPASKTNDMNTTGADNEVVQAAYADAKELDEEAKEIAAEARTASASADMKDTLAKQQLKQMTEALKNGDEGMSREYSRLSQLNADSAQKEKVLAHELDGEAKAKRAEADKALADAKQLEKNTGNLAANKSKADKKKEAKKEEKPVAQKTNDKDKPVKDASELIAQKDQKTSEAKKDSGSVTHNATAVAETNSSKTPAEQKSTSMADEKKAGSTPGADKTSEVSPEKKVTSGAWSTGTADENKNVTNAAPVTSYEAAKRASDLQAESKDLKLQADALNDQVKNSKDKEQNKKWSEEAKALEGQSKEKSKEADKTLAVAKELKKKEDKSAVAQKEETKTASVQKKEAEEPAAKSSSAETKKAPASKADNTSTDKKGNPAKAVVASNENKQGSIAPASADKATGSKPIEKMPSESAPVKIANPSLTQAESKKQAEVNEKRESVKPNAPTAESTWTTEIPKDVAPEAVNSYKEYLKTKQESDAQAKQSEVLQERIAKMPPSSERDQLVQQANDYTMQSIKSWQQAQIKLNQAKEADPSVESKLKNVQFADIPPEEKKSAGVTGSSSLAENNPGKNKMLTPQEIEKEKQKDSLINQAVTHRVIAENTPDSSTEKKELQKTKQLIMESSNPSKKETKSSIKNQPATATSKPGKDAMPPVNEINNGSKAIALNGKPAETSANKNDAAKRSSSNEKSSDKSVSNKEANEKLTAKATTSPGSSSESTIAANNTAPALDAKTLFVDEAAVYSISPKTIYSSSNPVPMDPPLPDGLVFKVQIGAFHTSLSPEAFKNVQPLSGETTRVGWIRYCVGLFRTFEPANLVKMEMRATGYKDAFVVAYYNGKRISLYDAYAIINRSGTNEKKLYADASEKETHRLNTLNISASKYPANNDADAASFYGTAADAANATVDESAFEYAVQVGVYKKSVVPRQLLSLIPLNAELYKNNLYRFTTGHYSVRSSADSMKQVAVNAGVKDAFVIIYKDSKRAGQDYTLSVAGRSSSSYSAPDKAPASISGGEITYKVQVGAYRSDISEKSLAMIKSQCNTELSQSTSASGLHLLFAGSFRNFNEAVALKNDVAAKGLKDAFVVAFSGNTRIPLPKSRK